MITIIIRAYFITLAIIIIVENIMGAKRLMMVLTQHYKPRTFGLPITNWNPRIGNIVLGSFLIFLENPPQRPWRVVLVSIVMKIKCNSTRHNVSRTLQHIINMQRLRKNLIGNSLVLFVHSSTDVINGIANNSLPTRRRKNKK